MNRDDIRAIICDFVTSDRGNLIPGSDTPIFEEPLLGVAAASDPWFSRLRDESVAGSGHRVPAQWLEGARSVISYFLPISEPVRLSNHDGDSPSEEWLFARFHGEALSDRIRRILVERLGGQGHGAVAPLLASGYTVQNLCSNWSERHVAFIAGLGTFGLNAGFITERGMAGRLGSVVTTLKLEPTPRPTEDHQANCLWFARGECGLCVDRCHQGALTEAGKNKDLCRNRGRSSPVRARYGFPGVPCGKCYVGVPCEAKNPMAGRD